jgi:hypothetical protein
MTLPPFPTDPASLSMLRDAITITEGSERTSLDDLLVLMSRMGGSDPDAVESYGVMPDPLNPDESVSVAYMRDPSYHPHDVIRSLIDLIERVRDAVTEDRHPPVVHSEWDSGYWEGVADTNNIVRRALAEGGTQ